MNVQDAHAGALTIDDGRAPEIRAVENVLRRTGRLGRCTGSPAAVGARIPTMEGRVRVTVRLGIRAGGEDDPRLPRAVLVRAQGRVRGAVLLVPRKKGVRTAPLEFDLDPGEIAPEGFLLVEFWDAAARAALPGMGGLAGVLIQSLHVQAPGAPASPLSLGSGEPAGRLAACGFFVVNPSADDVTVTLSAAPSAQRGRAARLLGLAAQRAAPWCPEPAARSLVDGADAAVMLARTGRDACEFLIPARPEPVVVFPDGIRAGHTASHAITVSGRPGAESRR
ncbi:hypothetical protein [Spirillospora albida]|uniref:hypothetical protein n=1 Tax=Spirillospora albida TaxID=58123 RepID=UPI0004C0AB4D|nr:hypothetical protein [Spirillospora albida]